MKHPKRSASNPLIPTKAEYCTLDDKRKRRYRTQLDAELNAPAPGLEQYICESCGAWHNGTPRKAKLV